MGGNTEKLAKDPWKTRWERVGEQPTGKGGQGLVYAGRSRDTKEPCAIKVYRPPNKGDAEELVKSRRARAQREVVVLETMRGAGVPAIYDHNLTIANVDDPRVPLFLVMEFIPGCTLEEYVESKAGGPKVLSLEECAVLVARLGETLSGLHAHSFFHRDIKPDNVMLSGKEVGKPVLIDFGLVGGDPFRTRATFEDEQLDNRFLSLPELKCGESPDVHSDTALFAGLLFYALTGKRPLLLVDEENRQPHQRHALPGLPGPQASRLKRFFGRAFQLRTFNRFGSIGELLEDFSGVVLSPEQLEKEAPFHAQVREHLARPALTSALSLAQFREHLEHALRQIDQAWSRDNYVPNMPDNSGASTRLVLGGVPDDRRHEEIWFMLVGTYQYPTGTSEAIAAFRIQRVEGGMLELGFAEDHLQAQRDLVFTPMDKPVGADSTGATFLAHLVVEKAKSHQNLLIECAVTHARNA